MRILRNPYEVLEINQGASEEEIKKAYREMVKKYHPDRYQDNPLYSLAEEKLREVNEAYEYLVKNGNSSNGSGLDGNNESWTSQANSEFYNQVKTHIRSGNVGAAEDMLDSTSDRTAPWYYLKGLIFLRKGWYDEARTNIQTAVNMDPGNFEYRDALNRINTSNGGFRNNSYGRGYNRGPDLCTMCQCMICTDCCCDGLGGC